MWDTIRGDFVRLGLRLQILLLLGGLLLLALPPLLAAVSAYTAVSLQQVREGGARSLGRAIASRVAEARDDRSEADLRDLVESEIGNRGALAVGVYESGGRRTFTTGDADVAANLPANVPSDREAAYPVSLSSGRALVVAIPHPNGAVAVLLRTDGGPGTADPVVRVVALYVGVIFLGLLVVAYYALGRFIVRPLGALSDAAQRVAGGARRLEVPRAGARELVDLGASLRSMTDRLLENEDALRKKIDEVEEATKSLRAAQANLVRSERLASVGRLAAGLAHEIGNPISALMGMQDLILEGALDETEQRDFIRRMRSETDRIHGILRDLLQFARPGDRPPEGTPVEPGDVDGAIRDTVTLVSPHKAVRDLTIDIDVVPGLPLVSLDRQQLVQVLLNLLLNAADASGPGGRIRVRAEPTGAGVCIAVEDSGPGVDPRIIDQIFEPFVTTKEVGKGTGLGLAVCRGLVETAGGTITIDSTYRDGARFVVTVPAAKIA